ncbi:hypothetical protein MMC22_007916 [Lobaria immixta]|nr:hypothetical protein [Lobaria immixta]
MFMRTRNSSETRQWPKTPALLKYRSSKWFILATVCVAAFSDAFIYAVVSIGASLELGSEGLMCEGHPSLSALVERDIRRLGG